MYDVYNTFNALSQGRRIFESSYMDVNKISLISIHMYYVC